MKRIQGKILSGILALSMVLQCTSVVAFADETDISVGAVFAMDAQESGVEYSDTQPSVSDGESSGGEQPVRPERPANDESTQQNNTPPPIPDGELPDGELPERPEGDELIELEDELILEVAMLELDVLDLEYTPDCGGYPIDGTWIALTTENATISASGNYYVTEGLQTDITITGGAEVNLALDGKTLTGMGNASVITVESGATLNLYDATDGTGVITGGNKNVTTLTTYYGGGIQVAGTLNMYGGTISENKAGYGGGVYVKDAGATATFNMYGGAIKNNEVLTSGGGVYVKTGTLNIDGGSITGNKSSSAGGGLTIADANATISDSEIADNSSVVGGGFYIASNSVTIADTDITRNTATDDGGGLYISRGTINITDTDITDNSATNDGDDMYVKSGTVSVTDGTMDTAISVAAGTVTRGFTSAFTYGDVYMSKYFVAASDTFAYSVETGEGSFTGSMFTPAEGASGNFALKAYTDDSSAVGNLAFSMKAEKTSTSQSYYIKATAKGNGTVAQEGKDRAADSMYKVSKWADVTFEFTPDDGYEVTDVIVNGKSIGACDVYEFEDIVITMQTLEVVFAEAPVVLEEVDISADMSGMQFAADTAITVEQFVTFLYRYAILLGADMEVKGTVDLTGYGIAEDAYDAMVWAVENGIISESDLAPTAEALQGVDAATLMNGIMGTM